MRRRDWERRRRTFFHRQENRQLRPHTKLRQEHRRKKWTRTVVLCWVEKWAPDVVDYHDREPWREELKKKEQNVDHHHQVRTSQWLRPDCVVVVVVVSVNQHDDNNKRKTLLTGSKRFSDFLKRIILTFCIGAVYCVSTLGRPADQLIKHTHAHTHTLQCVVNLLPGDHVWVKVRGPLYSFISHLGLALALARPRHF